jgi:proline utilization trans-activator
MEATYSRQTELLGQCKDIGWLVCLALVFAFGCEQLHEHDPGQAHALRLKYLDFAKAYFRKLLTTILDKRVPHGSS